jgi:hypothetical protein
MQRPTSRAEAFLHDSMQRARQMLFLDWTEYIMKNLLALAAVAALMSACAGFSGTAADGTDGAVVAAMLGYHGRGATAGGNDGN